jgi:hypothetical protein
MQRMFYMHSYLVHGSTMTVKLWNGFRYLGSLLEGFLYFFNAWYYDMEQQY